MISKTVLEKLQERTFVDREGNVWRREVDTWTFQFDLSKLDSIFQEMSHIRELDWLVKLQDQLREFEAVPKLHAHGWRDNRSLVYYKIVESPEANLYNLVMSGSQEARVPGSTKLLVSRVVLSILETVEELYCKYNQVLCSVNARDLFLRKGWQSGYMCQIDFQNAFPNTCNTCGYPYFKPTCIQRVTIADSYNAVLLCFLKLMCPAEFSDVISVEM